MRTDRRPAALRPPKHHWHRRIYARGRWQYDIQGWMVSARRGLKVRNLTKTCICSGASRSWSADLFRKAPEETTYVDPQQISFYIVPVSHAIIFLWHIHPRFNLVENRRRGGRFRQTGITGGKGNIIVGTVLGVLSGKYIFEEPLQHYWEAKRAEEAGTVTPTASDNAGKS